jgi:antitoxin component HigA of HigAB toxin-antitoxin module
MSAVIDTPKEYLRLIKRFPLLPINSESKLDAAIEIMKELTHPRKKLSISEAGYLKILTILIREYESKYYAPAKCTPQELVEALMKEHKLNQTALAAELGMDRANLSAFLSHNRHLSKTNALKLSEHFKVDVRCLLA